MNKIICFDFDKTITSFPKVFFKTMEMFQEDGVNVIVCTMRKSYDVFCGNRKATEEDKKMLDKISDMGIPIYYTDGEAKGVYLFKKDIIPHVFIDDNPEYILYDVGYMDEVEILYSLQIKSENYDNKYYYDNVYYFATLEEAQDFAEDDVEYGIDISSKYDKSDFNNLEWEKDRWSKGIIWTSNFDKTNYIIKEIVV